MMEGIIIWRYSALLLQLLILQLTASAEGVSGGSGEWGEWSACSRTCGPAISVQEKNCSIPGCGEGPRLQYRSCPNKPCEEEVDLRKELCATFSNANLTFFPLSNEGQCLLTCKATTWDDGHVVVQGPLEAFPGTHCTTATGGPGICISSVCTPIGCDGLAGSTKAVDKCGRCISPNLSNKVCSRNSGPITKNPTTGHVEMIRLPVGASTVSVTNHLPPRLASIMVRSETGDFLFSVGPPGHIFEAGGTEFEYHVSVEGGNFTESLTTNGTLNNSITIEVYIPSQRVAPSISYEYHSLENVETWGRTGTRDRGPPLLSPPNNIDWSYGPFLSCTETCTTGIQVAYAVCTDLDFNNRILPDNYCSGSEKPTPIVRHCGSGNCAPRWVTRDWLPCSQTRCGVGSQQRLVQCMVLEANGRDSMVTDDLCPLASKPRHERECLMTESTGCGTEWEEDEWGECCSTEPLERRIQCVDSGGAVQPPFFCSHLHRNSSLRPCEKGPCTNGGCSWIPKRWFSCNNTCGRGVQKRNVRCRRNSDNKAAPGYCCQEKPLPQLQRDCYDDRASWCRPQWHARSWEQCRGECGVGRGQRSRPVNCWAENRHDLRAQFPHQFCSNQSQPAALENCTRNDGLCANCSWVTTPWSDCYCPAEVKIRNVLCSSGLDECCFQRETSTPPEADMCDCFTTDQPTSSTPTEETCTDYTGVKCNQLKEDGYCSEDNTNFIKLLCCQTCSGVL